MDWKWRRKEGTWRGWKRWAELLSFCWFAHRGTHPEHLSRASYDTQVASALNAPISQLSPFLSLSLSLSLSLPHPVFHGLSLVSSVSMYSYALTPQPLCCPRAWLLTDAGWECRAQLGLIAAVYLIKTWEDPTGAKARGRHKALFIGFEHRCAHTGTPPHPGRAKKTGASLCLRRPGSCSHLSDCVFASAYLTVLLDIFDTNQIYLKVWPAVSHCEAIQTRIIGKEWGGTTRVLKEC